MEFGVTISKLFFGCKFHFRGYIFLTHRWGVHKVDQCLNNSVVCGVHVGVQGEGALAMTVEGLVVVRRNYPLLPSEVLEAHPGRYIFVICKSNKWWRVLDQPHLHTPEYTFLAMPISELAAICINVRISIAPIKVILNGRVLLLFLLGPSVACALSGRSFYPRGS